MGGWGCSYSGSLCYVFDVHSFVSNTPQVSKVLNDKPELAAELNNKIKKYTTSIQVSKNEECNEKCNQDIFGTPPLLVDPGQRREFLID